MDRRLHDRWTDRWMVRQRMLRWIFLFDINRNKACWLTRETASAWATTTATTTTSRAQLNSLLDSNTLRNAHKRHQLHRTKPMLGRYVISVIINLICVFILQSNEHIEKLAHESDAFFLPSLALSQMCFRLLFLPVSILPALPIPSYNCWLLSTVSRLYWPIGGAAFYLLEELRGRGNFSCITSDESVSRWRSGYDFH